MKSSSGQSLVHTFQGHSDSVISVAVSPDGKFVYTGSEENTVRKWDSSSGKCLSTFQGHGSLTLSVAVSPDGKYVYSGSCDTTVKKWDSSNGQCLSTFKGHSERVTSVAVSADGKYVYSGSYDKTVKKWDSSSGKCLSTFEGHAKCVYSVAVSPNGEYVYSGSGDGTVKEWNSSNGECMRTFHRPSKSIFSVAVSPDGKSIYTGNGDNTINKWDLSSGQVQIMLKGHSSTVYSVAISPDGKYIYSGSGDKTVRKWGSSGGQCLSKFKGHLQHVTSIVISPDGRYIYSGSVDKTVMKWDPSINDTVSKPEAKTPKGKPSIKPKNSDEETVNINGILPSQKKLKSSPSSSSTIDQQAGGPETPTSIREKEISPNLKNSNPGATTLPVSRDGNRVLNSHSFTGSLLNQSNMLEAANVSNDGISKPKAETAKEKSSTKRKQTDEDTVNIGDSPPRGKKSKSSQSSSSAIDQQSGGSRTPTSTPTKPISTKEKQSNGSAVAQPVNTTESNYHASAFVNVPTINEKAWIIKEVTNNPYAYEVMFTGPATYEIGYIKLKGNAEQRSTFLEALKHGIATATKVVNDELKSKIRISYVGHTENLAKRMNKQHFFKNENGSQKNGGKEPVKLAINWLRKEKDIITVFLIRYVRWPTKQIATKVESEMLDYYFYPWNKQVECPNVIKKRIEKPEKRFDIHKKKFFEIKEEHCRVK